MHRKKKKKKKRGENMKRGRRIQLNPNANIGCIWEWVAKLEKIVAQVKICHLPKTLSRPMWMLWENKRWTRG